MGIFCGPLSPTISVKKKYDVRGENDVGMFKKKVRVSNSKDPGQFLGEEFWRGVLDRFWRSLFLSFGELRREGGSKFRKN
jgi:hypothetical protein